MGGKQAHGTSVVVLSAPASRGDTVTVASQGSFAVGGTVVTRDGSFDSRKPMNPAGQTLHGDHARVTFQVPVDARPLPLLFWHGWWVDSSCWDTTPDGREGFRTLFLRRRFAVYLLDQPRRGSAGKTTAATPASTEPNEQWFFNQFRFGLWPDLYDGGQFASDPAALEQFFRAMVPDTGPLDTEVIVAAASAAIDRIGPLVLVTHSHAGGFGWLTQLRNRNVRAVVSIEPGSGFVFPDSELPDAMPSSNGTLEPVPISVEEFKALTRACRSSSTTATTSRPSRPTSPVATTGECVRTWPASGWTPSTSTAETRSSCRCRSGASTATRTSHSAISTTSTSPTRYRRS
jgi:hypothetical protein